MSDLSHQAIAITAPPTTALVEVPNKLESGIDKPRNISDAPNVNDEDEYASGINLLLLIISLTLGMFLVALDNVCQSSLTKAIPHLQNTDQQRPSSAPPSPKSPTNSATCPKCHGTARRTS
jgi:hypothetical protein